MIETRDLRGIGGWLFYFCLGQVGWAAFTIYDLVTTFGALRSTRSLSDTQVSDAHAIIACDAIIVLVCAAGLALAFVKHRLAPDFWVLATFTLGWVAVFRNAILADLSHPNVGPTSEESGAILRSALVMIAWFIYWLRSRRVAATYGSNGKIRQWLNRVWLDKARPAPTS